MTQSNLPAAPSADFVSDFKSLTGFPPFRWQRRLYEEHLSVGSIPSAIDIPTGLGKTAVMAVWLLARAAGANLPRRLVYVVDRRAVVDQATRFAEQLRCRMTDGVARRLGLSNSFGRLPISTLRGGFADNKDWLADPTAHAIVVGTVDMIGSRLLFEGYGVSRGMRPYHAGFLGADVLLLLDEAHLCPPFEALLRQIERQRDGELGGSNRDTATPPFYLTSLSATGRKLPGESRCVFRLNDDERRDPIVQLRITANKMLSLTEIEQDKNRLSNMVTRAAELATDPVPSRVILYFDRRKDAVDSKRLIDKQFRQMRRERKIRSEWPTNLLTGARRVYERAQLERWLLARGFIGESWQFAETPTVLIATAAGEVGVDLDADHMVCDLVAHERMVQRLGRVNRRGDEGRHAKVHVFAAPPTQKQKASEAAKKQYEHDIATYRQRMNALVSLPRLDGLLDASISGIGSLKRDHPGVVEKATTPAPLYPRLDGPLVDSWSMTSLSQHPGRPAVSPWLRGWTDDEPRTTVVWRRHLPVVVQDTADPTGTNTRSKVRRSIVNDFFRLAPIHVVEKLETSPDAVWQWILKRGKKVADSATLPDSSVSPDDVVALVLDQRSKFVECVTLETLRDLGLPSTQLSIDRRQWAKDERERWKTSLLPNRLIVVDKKMGGLVDGLLQPDGTDDALTTADDQFGSSAGTSADADGRPGPVRFSVREVDLTTEPERRADGWKYLRTVETHFSTTGAATKGLAIDKWHDDFADEESRSVLSRPQSLADHAKDASLRVRQMARKLGFSEQEVAAFGIAALHHDDGKAAVRWQNAMNAPMNGRPYAKTEGQGNWRQLGGYRHEFGSLVKAEGMDFPEPICDLILHLIAAHHGNARPIIATDGCEEGPPSVLEIRAGRAARRFVRLQRQYGPWGLAWREAILRAADHAVSREWSAAGRLGGEHG